MARELVYASGEWSEMIEAVHKEHQTRGRQKSLLRISSTAGRANAY